MHKVESQNTTYKMPSEHDLDYQLPKHGIFNERFHMWLASKWNVSRDEVLDNTKVNQYSMYYQINNRL